MRNAGYVVLNRKGLQDLDNRIQDYQLRCFFICLLLKAAYTSHTFQGVTIERGQLPTSIRKLAQASCLNETTIRSYLDRLVRLNEISKESAGNNTKRGTIITICKYDYYTSTATERTTERTTEKPQREQQTTEIKEKEIKDFMSVYARARGHTHNEFISFKKLLKGIAPDLLEMRYKLSEIQYFKLKKKFGLEKFFEALFQIGNNNNTTQYISAYKTVETYIENDQGCMQLEDYLCAL